IRLSKCDLQEKIREGGISRAGRRHRFQNVLIVSQIAIALVLLIASGLMFRSFQRVQQVNPGFEPANLLVFQVALPPLKFNNQEKTRAFMDEALTRIRSAAGIRSAAAAENIPFSDSEEAGSFFIEGRPITASDEPPHGELWFASEGYFETMRIPI